MGLLSQIFARRWEKAVSNTHRFCLFLLLHLFSTLSALELLGLHCRLLQKSQNQPLNAPSKDKETAAEQDARVELE